MTTTLRYLPRLGTSDRVRLSLHHAYERPEMPIGSVFLMREVAEIDLQTWGLTYAAAREEMLAELRATHTAIADAIRALEANTPPVEE